MTSFSITWFSLASFLASWHVVENRRELLQLEVCVLDGALEVPDVDEAVQGALGHHSPVGGHGQRVNDGVLTLVTLRLGHKKVNH